ncbi:MAG: phosphate acyltransferase PlsX [Kiritimatiellae bacterium]|nr:phosphate acyltransferase PlsX [Kiritimatiellia bacterium]
MTRVALDAMGGDYAPKQVIVGGIEAVLQVPDLKVFLVGNEEVIRKTIKRFSKRRLADAQKALDKGLIEIVHAPDQVEMEDIPVEAVRKKKDCSINVAMRLVKEGKADAFVSAGNSGAVATSAILNLGRINGVKRPAIAMVLPTNTPSRPLLLLDSGANMDCHPEWLVQFAIMGNIYSKTVLRREKPEVGLLSIGTEDCKGNQLTHETYPELKKLTDIDFVGNIEGHDICGGQLDVAVCDGFVGNVVLKTVESVAHAIGGWLKAELKKTFFRKICALLLKPAFNALKKQMDPEVYGGAPLLGVPGTVIITHGNSTHKGIFYAVKSALAAARNDVSGLIEKAIAKQAENLQQ